MPSRPASSRTSMHLHNNTSYAHPSAAARRAPAAAAAAHAGHDLYHESADFSHAAGLQQQQQNNSSSSSMQPFAYSRSALLSLWDDKASAPLPPDMAASLSALSTDHPHLNNNNNNNNNSNHHHQQHPAHLVIASESVGKPLGMAPMSPEEEKWFLQTASSSSSSSNNNNNNNNSDMSNGSGRRQMLNGIGLGHAAASGGTTSPGGTGAMPRRANSNSLRSNGAGLAGIQGGVLGSVAPPPVSRRGHRNVDSVDGKTAMGSSRSGHSTPVTESPQATGARQAKDPLRSDGVATWRKSHDAPAATQRNGGASPPAHWDSEAEPGDQDDDDDNDIIAAAANASQRNHLSDSPQEPQQQARPTLPSRPSLADLAHDSEAVDLAAHASSRRSSAAPTPAGGASPAASMLVEDPLLRRRVFAAAGGAAPGSRTTSASSTPDPIGASLPGASVSPAPGAALGRPPGIPAPASPVKERPEDVQWQYQDPSGNVQGPFTGAQMQTWYEHQYFQDDLHVRRISPPQSAFLPLGTLKVKVGDSVKPFLTPPPSAQPAPEVPPWAASNPASAYQVPAVSSPLPFGQQPQQSPADPLFRAASGRPMSGGQQQQAYDPFSMASPMNGGLDQLQSLRAAALLQQQQQQPATDPWGMPIRQQPALSWQQQQQLQYLQQQQQQQLSAQFGLASPVSPMDHQQQQQQQQPRHPVSLSPEVMAQSQPQSQAVASPWGAPAAEKVAAAQQAAASSTHDSPALSAGVIGSSAPQTPAFKPEPREEPQPQAQVEVKQVPTPAPAELPSQEAEKQEDTRDPATQAADSAAEALVQDQEEHDTNAAAKKAGKNAPKVNVLPSKSQGKAANKTNKAVVESETTPSVSPAPSSAASATSKAAPWAVPETSDQPTRISSGPSLREIQAKEAKEEEARKAATKKAKAAALASEQAVLAAQAEQEASMPWAQNGGSRSASSSATAASSSAAPWSQPVSSTHANGTKKSLKEIQQEEEARAKKLQAQKQAQQAQAASAVGASSSSSSSSSSVPSVGVRAGGGYAGSLGPKTAPAPSPLGGSWATVGSNGKSSAPAVPKPAAPAPKPAAPAASVVKPAAPAPAKPAAQVASKPAPAPQPSEHQPSPEFLSWMKSALQGLTIPIEEFIQMLLQFPVQADASTLEIISDAVYANSRTLDGRRFAEQFALKRKADAGMSTKGKQPTVPPVAAPVPPTAAQILQAKPKQDDGFSFKVVPKKGKKGGRS